MDKKKIGKIAALVMAAVACALCAVSVDNWQRVALFVGCPLSNRLAFHFFHANLFHAAVNAWCLLAVVFVYELSIWRIFVAFAIAAAAPLSALSLLSPDFFAPTVGLSAVVFALFGSISFEVARKLYYQKWMAVYLALGFLLPNVNEWLHLYCYAAGLAVALLNKPFKIYRYG